MNDAELAEYWKRQTIHYRNLANIYLQQLLATKTRPERHYGKTTFTKTPQGTRQHPMLTANVKKRIPDHGLRVHGTADRTMGLVCSGGSMA